MKSNEYGGWRMIVFWAAVSVAALITGFVLGWLWCARSGSLSDVRLLDVMTAFGTVGAAVGAVVIAVVGHNRQKAYQFDVASRYARSNIDNLASMSMEIFILSGRLSHAGVSEIFADTDNALPRRLTEVATALKAIDVAQIGVAYPYAADLIIEARISLFQAFNFSGNLPGSKDQCLEHLHETRDRLQKAWIYVLNMSPVDPSTKSSAPSSPRPQDHAEG